MVQCSAGGVPALGRGEVRARGGRIEERDAQRSRCSSQMTLSSRAPLPCTQLSMQASQVCNSSRNVQGRVQSSTITTAVWGRECCGCKNWETREVYEGAEDGTV
jgi:hypothetical protein